jgi:muramoyltetrapeptide carboxypeptidase LdcA involved in peptidoglycan recycling
VVLIEDVNERPYRIDRMLTQLQQAGILARASALVFGEFPGCDEPGAAVSVREVVAQACADQRGPVILGFPAGHTTGPAWTLPLGVRVRVVADPVAPALVVISSASAVWPWPPLQPCCGTGATSSAGRTRRCIPR